LKYGRPGEKYNIGGQNERTNLEVVDTICAALEQIVPASENPSLKLQGMASYSELKSFVTDRPGMIGATRSMPRKSEVSSDGPLENGFKRRIWPGRMTWVQRSPFDWVRKGRGGQVTQRERLGWGRIRGRVNHSSLRSPLASLQSFARGCICE
jgi:hypothetical protein